MSRQKRYEKDWRQIVDGTKTATQIAEEYGIQRNTVYVACKRYGLKPARSIDLNFCKGIHADILKEELKVMFVTDVARKHGIELSFLIKWLSVRRIPYRTKRQQNVESEAKLMEIKAKTPPENVMDTIKSLLPEYSNVSIARVFGYSREWIRRIRQAEENNQ